MSILRSLFGLDEKQPIDNSRFITPQAITIPENVLALADDGQNVPKLILRPIMEGDASQWLSVRGRNADWLHPWEAGNPLPQKHPRALGFVEWVKTLREGEEAGTSLVMVVIFDQKIVGQISLGAINYGAMRSAVVGYWVDERYDGRGFTPWAVAMLADSAFEDSTGPRLHRLEINVLPENEKSLRVVHKLGLTDEGIRSKYMFVNGQWRDHRSFSLLSDDVPNGLCMRYIGKDKKSVKL